MSNRSRIRTAATLALIAVGVGVGGSMLARRGEGVPAGGAGGSAGFLVSTQETVRERTEDVVIRVARQATPAVVAVGVRGSSGSGVIIRQDGVVITNAHVVRNLTEVEVGLADGRRVAGRHESTAARRRLRGSAGRIQPCGPPDA
jgi:S1-C subfamily serine protease